MPDGQIAPETQRLVDETCQWLLDNPLELYTPEHFFDVKWIRYKVVVIGERHNDTHHRALVAKKIRRWGGPHVGLGLEITPKYQEAIDAYLNGSGEYPQNPRLKQPVYRTVLEAARASKTPVVAMDSSAEPIISVHAQTGKLSKSHPNRDMHMARSVMDLVHTKSKVLVLVGMVHASEGRWSSKATGRMGVRLTEKLGTRCYTINTLTEKGHGDRHIDQHAYYKTFKAAFGKRGDGIAFDVDRSPLAKAALTDVRGSLPWGTYCDGLMVFFKP